MNETRERGQSVLELMLALPVIAGLLFGGVELARGVGLRSALDSGVSVAARTLSLDPAQWSWAVQAIQDSLDANPLGDSGNVGALSVTAYDAAGNTLSPAALAGLPFGTRFRLAASVEYTPDFLLFSSHTVTIRVEHRGIVERYP